MNYSHMSLRYEQTLRRAHAALRDDLVNAASDSGGQLEWDDLLAEIDDLVATIPEGVAARQRGPAHDHGLSVREHEVLRLMAEGASNRGIADDLSLSERTIENHVRHILDKLGLDSRTAAAIWAVRHGLA